MEGYMRSGHIGIHPLNSFSQAQVEIRNKTKNVPEQQQYFDLSHLISVVQRRLLVSAIYLVSGWSRHLSLTLMTQRLQSLRARVTPLLKPYLYTNMSSQPRAPVRITNCSVLLVMDYFIDLCCDPRQYLVNAESSLLPPQQEYKYC